MKTVCRVAATVGALAAQAARVGDDETMLLNGTIAEPDEAKTKKLNKWLNDHTLPSGDQEKMDGSVDDPIWAYMKSDCFQGRYRTAVKYMSQKKCKTAIEVGGYLTPLDKFILEAKKEGKSESNMPTKYVNIDPSMKEGKVEKNDGLESYHLPMTLADFFSSETESLRKEMGIKADPSDTCVLIFGIWDPHYKTDDDKAAMGKFMKNAMWAAVETSEYAKNWLETSAKVCEKMGMTLVKDEDADCREALKGEKPDTSILRHMKFYERKDESKAKSKSKSDDSDDDDDSDDEDKPKPGRKGGKKNTKKTSKDEDDDSLVSEEDSEDDESEASEESSEEEDEEVSSKKSKKDSKAKDFDDSEDDESEKEVDSSEDEEEEEETSSKKNKKESKAADSLASDEDEAEESEAEEESSEDEDEVSSKKSKKAEESESEEDDSEDEEEEETSSKKSKKVSKH